MPCRTSVWSLTRRPLVDSQGRRRREDGKGSRVSRWESSVRRIRPQRIVRRLFSPSPESSTDGVLRRGQPPHHADHASSLARTGAIRGHAERRRPSLEHHGHSLAGTPRIPVASRLANATFTVALSRFRLVVRVQTETDAMGRRQRDLTSSFEARQAGHNDLRGRARDYGGPYSRPNGSAIATRPCRGRRTGRHTCRLPRRGRRTGSPTCPASGRTRSPHSMSGSASSAPLSIKLSKRRRPEWKLTGCTNTRSTSSSTSSQRTRRCGQKPRPLSRAGCPSRPRTPAAPDSSCRSSAFHTLGLLAEPIKILPGATVDHRVPESAARIVRSTATGARCRRSPMPAYLGYSVGRCTGTPSSSRPPASMTRAAWTCLGIRAATACALPSASGGRTSVIWTSR